LLLEKGCSEYACRLRAIGLLLFVAGQLMLIPTASEFTAEIIAIDHLIS